jgi:kynurenine formamidase
MTITTTHTHTNTHAHAHAHAHAQVNFLEDMEEYMIPIVTEAFLKNDLEILQEVSHNRGTCLVCICVCVIPRPRTAS